MTGVSTPSLVIFEVRPNPWTLDWLLWVLDPKGDQDAKRHQCTFQVGRLAELTDEKLMCMAEDVVGMRVDPFV
jgi:hypothetical protein